VGLNFAKSESSIPINSGFEQKIENGIIENFNKYKLSRNPNKVDTSLQSLNKAVCSESALMPAIKESLKAGATIGEICFELSRVWEKNK
jgi:methylmalonyl-CoA mutase N-terminal domain/subunit